MEDTRQRTHQGKIRLTASKMSGSNVNPDSEISESSSKRMCQHMNEDHAVSVFAMAKSVLSLKPGWKLSGARLKKVSLSGCEIQAITCRKDMCQAHKVFYPFEPPLQTAEESRSRLVQIHQKETKPKLGWLLKPSAVVILPALLFITWGSQMATEEALADALGYIGFLLPINDTLSTSLFRQIIDFAFYFTLAAHAIEASFVVYHGFRFLKLSFSTLVMWIVPVSVFGYPFFVEFRELVRVKHESRQPKGS